MIVADRLSKTFGRFLAVHSIDFEIPKGQVVGFLGPNGAGKTTTLRMICGYLRPSGGRVLVDGIDVREHPRRVQKLLGYLPESAPLYADMRVDEYLAFRGRIFGLRRAQRGRAVDAAVERCWLGEVRRRPIAQLSKGYRQRVGLASVLLHAPPVLILDEPTTGLDPAQIRETRGLIRELAGSHTVLLSSHNLTEVELTCDRIIMLAGGRIRMSGTIDELRRNAADEHVYMVETDSGKACGLLEALPEVAEVRLSGTDGGWHRLTVAARPKARDLREPIAQALASAGGTTRELRREAPSLERLFVRVIDEGLGS